MTAGRVVEQHLVIHRYLPADGPEAVSAYQGLRALWAGCRRVFGMTDRIDGLTLPAHLPADPDEFPAGPADAALAGQERPGSGYQMVLRRHHDLFTVSIALAPRVVAADGRASVDPAAAADPRLWWTDLERAWQTANERHSGGLLGEAVLYAAVIAGPGPATDRDAGTGVATVPDAEPSLDEACARELAALLPPEPVADGWWTTGAPAGGGFTVWETSPREDGRALRRLLVVADERDEAGLSAWLWSHGGVEMPPLARYLSHAAKIRYQLRVWRRDRERLKFGTSVVDAASHLRRSLGDDDPAGTTAPGPGEHPQLDLNAARSTELATVLTGTALRQMRHTVQIATANMTNVAGIGGSRGDGRGPFDDDLALARWFVQQLADDDAYLTADAEQARRVVAIGDALLAAGVPAASVIAAGTASPHVEVISDREAVRTDRRDDGATVGTREADAPRDADAARGVFVIHGRDGQVRDRMFDFLRSLDLRPMEWEPLVTAAGSTAPYLRDVVSWGVAHARAAVVLLTPDDEVSLHADLRLSGDSAAEAEPGMQARPNVLLELGMALAVYPNRTLVVQVGQTRPVADLGGLNFIRLDDGPDCRRKIASRLRQAGCAVDDRGSDWLAPGRFAGLGAYTRRARG